MTGSSSSSGSGVASGTHVCTERGDVRVEELRPGDVVVATSGELHSIRSIRKRTVEVWQTGEMETRSTSPVRIARHAFGPHRPVRDLVVAPDQPICLSCIEDVLVPARLLVNGSTIARTDDEMATFWLVDLDCDQLLLAEDVGIATGAWGRAATEAAPRLVQSGPVLEAIRVQIGHRAEALGWAPCHDVSISCLADGRRLAPVLADNHATFVFHDGGAHLKIQTSMTVPAEIGGVDIRRLGIAVYAVTVIDADGEFRALSLDDPKVRDCFHPADPGQPHRWTRDDLVIPDELCAGLHSPLTLRLTYEPSTIRGWRKPREGNVVAIDSQLRTLAQVL